MHDYPRLFRLRQHFPRPRVDDVPAEVDRQLAALDLGQNIQPGQSVAITVGSRGIAQLPAIVRAIAMHLRNLRAEPFVVPAMGSHGGATAKGQRQLVESYGVTEEAVGCPIRSSMDTVVVCRAAEGFPVHFDRHAFNADHVLVFNRIKPHTKFAGKLQSGLMKMMLIGLGKHAGAEVYHAAIEDFDFDRIVRSVAREVITRCRILAGLAVLENAYDEIAQLVALAPQQIPQQEPAFLEQASQWMPRLPFAAADILAIDEIGKDISGTGMDTNVIGRKFGDHRAATDETPKIKRIIVRGLSPKTHRNASGIGLAEFCLSRIVDEMDVDATRINCLTANHVTGAMIPLHYRTDREVLDAALSTVGLTQPADVKLMWIRNTLHLAELYCSQAYLGEAERREDLQIVEQPVELTFGEDGCLKLPSPW
jgi:hypothetical protein